MFLYLLSLSISIHYINQYQTPVLPMSCISSISSISSSISMISVDIKSISISINIYHIASICMISFDIKSISITHVLLHNITFPSISIISIDIKLILIAIVGMCWSLLYTPPCRKFNPTSLASTPKSPMHWEWYMSWCLKTPLNKENWSQWKDIEN